MTTSTYAVIVEDDQYSVDVLTNLLSRLKITYKSVVDGSRIINVIKELPRVDVVFLDLELPVSTGYEVFHTLKANQELSHIPVVAYTSHTNEKATARKLGFSGFLSKPLNGGEFPLQLERILKREPVWE